MKSIAAPPEAAPQRSMDIPDASTLVDLALNRSGIVGSGDKVVDELLPSERRAPRTSLITWLLLGANIALPVALVVYWFGWRNRHLSRGV